MTVSNSIFQNLEKSSKNSAEASNKGEIMNDQEFTKIFEMPEAKNGNPIFRHPKYGILIAGDGEFAGEKELCATCQADLDEFGGYDQDCDCQQDIRFIGLWSPIDWKYAEPATYAIIDENTTGVMKNYDGWSMIDMKDLSFTGKFKR